MFYKKLYLLPNGKVLDFERIHEITFEDGDMVVIEKDKNAIRFDLGLTKDKLRKLSVKIINQYNKYYRQKNKADRQKKKKAI